MNVLTDKKFSELSAWADEAPVPLSPDSPCDEGVVIRAEGITPKATKFKFQRFYEHEEAQFSREVIDLETSEDM